MPRESTNIGVIIAQPTKFISCLACSPYTYISQMVQVKYEFVNAFVHARPTCPWSAIISSWLKRVPDPASSLTECLNLRNILCNDSEINRFLTLFERAFMDIGLALGLAETCFRLF